MADEDGDGDGVGGVQDDAGARDDRGDDGGDDK